MNNLTFFTQNNVFLYTSLLFGYLCPTEFDKEELGRPLHLRSSQAWKSSFARACGWRGSKAPDAIIMLFGVTRGSPVASMGQTGQEP